MHLKALIAGLHMLHRLSLDFKFQTDFTLPQKKRYTINLPGSVQSTLNNSATRTSLAMILDAYESPSRRLSHNVSLVSRFEVPLAQWNCGVNPVPIVYNCTPSVDREPARIPTPPSYPLAVQSATVPSPPKKWFGSSFLLPLLPPCL